MSSEVCVGCGARFPAVDGPVHRYMESSPACWAAYGDILAREYSDIRYAAVHQMTVDAYAVQHPGHPSPQSIQSVGLHLVSLCLVLEHGVETTQARAILQQSNTFKDEFVWLEPPPDRGRITVADVQPASTPEEHVARVRSWADSAWKAWSLHHDAVHAWANKFGIKRR
jgi:hypothetical protein